jgi:hypothetical protein
MVQCKKVYRCEPARDSWRIHALRGFQPEVDAERFEVPVLAGGCAELRCAALGLAGPGWEVGHQAPNSGMRRLLRKAAEIRTIYGHVPLLRLHCTMNSNRLTCKDYGLRRAHRFR